MPADPSRRIRLVAYADQPFDARTSTLAVVDGEEFEEASLPLLKPLGAPVVAQCQSDHVLFWRQTARLPCFLERVPAGNIVSYFRERREDLAPGAVYRAKVWGRMDEAWQLDFVDVGLLPVIEQSAGEKLRDLLERAVTATKSALGWKKDISEPDGRWLLKAVFWLLAVKILQDKGVPGFIRVDLCELESVYLKLARHYNKDEPRPVQITDSHRRRALLVAAKMIRDFGHCGAVTTESLVWVYESALIDRVTRQKLGTHSTPTWLVDDIVARLRSWIEKMPVDERRVFEPACGHAGFLISAMRLLSELLPANRAAERKTYLRRRLHGIEVDSFAYEVARLSLTLADVPNDNGWMLENADMFSDDSLRNAVAKANIVLANPPFEKFGDARPNGAMYSRADETFRQIVEALPLGGVFGIVMPKTILHSTQGMSLRRKLLDEYEIDEITIFADKVFNYGEPETAVIIGRRVGRGKKSIAVRYRRVREEQIDVYARTLTPSSVESVAVNIFEAQGGSLFVPELADVWRALQAYPRLGQLVDGGQGFQHKGKDDPTLPRDAIRESDVRVEGLEHLRRGFAAWHEDQLTHDLPKLKWLNLDPAVIRRKLHGTVAGRKQIILNYPPVSRGAWRLKALPDLKGHPVTSDFNVFRPRGKEVSPIVLWAVLNSPVANAFAYILSSSKRQVLAGTLRKMPVFAMDAGPFEVLEAAVETYLKASKGAVPLRRRDKVHSTPPKAQLSLGLENDEASLPADDELKYLHWRIDAEVLRLYDLPPLMERRILELFTGVQRRGVPFVQNEYFPKGFDDLYRLGDLLAITADWAQTNRQRCQLIQKDVKGRLHEKEREELARLERLADARIAWVELQQPTVSNEVERTVERLKREGRWDA